MLPTGRVCSGALGAAAGLATADHVLLHALERRPQAVADVLGPARLDQLLGRHRGGPWPPVSSTVRSPKRSARAAVAKAISFGRRELQRLHRLGVLAHRLELVEHAERAFDHLALDVALVRDADVVHHLAHHQAVAADEAEHAGQHLVRAGAVVAVDQDDLVRLGPGLHLAGVAHADHVLGELRLAFDAAGALGDHEGLEALLAQAAQDVDGGDVGVALGAARVLALGEDGRRRGAHLVFAQGLVATHHAGVAGKAGRQGRGRVHDGFLRSLNEVRRAGAARGFITPTR
jgi:hypothetical protein